MRMLTTIAGWVLVVGGLFWAYEGLTGNDLVEQLVGTGTGELIVDIVLFGGAALVWAAGSLMGRSSNT